jgi:hypothetical protein
LNCADGIEKHLTATISHALSVEEGIDSASVTSKPQSAERDLVIVQDRAVALVMGCGSS